MDFNKLYPLTPTGIENQYLGGIPVIETLARVTAHLWSTLISVNLLKLSGDTMYNKERKQNSL